MLVTVLVVLGAIAALVMLLVVNGWYASDPDTAAVRVVESMHVDEAAEELGYLHDPFESARFIAIPSGEDAARLAGFDDLGVAVTTEQTSPLYLWADVGVGGSRDGVCTLTLQERSDEEYEQIISEGLRARPDGDWTVFQISGHC